MTSHSHRRNRIAVWFESSRRPGLILAGVVFLLYGRSLRWDFMLDDLRQVRLMEDYHQGRRASLDLYKFLNSSDGNLQARRAGWYPWWLDNDVRYRHWRPISERMIYLEYLAFGEHPAAFRCVGLLLYAIGLRVVLGLFRILSGDERLSRWAALVFAVLASHAVPVVFISSQSDLLSLNLAAAAMILACLFIRAGGLWRLLLAAAIYAVSLGAKEASLPMAALPLCLWLTFRDRTGSGRRAIGTTLLFLLVGFVWLGFYLAGGYGSNNAVMLDPIGAPLQYIAALPGRSLALLSSMMIPINPFLFYLRPRGTSLFILYCTIGAAAWILFIRMLWRRHRRQRGVLSMALWMIPFMPLLVCTAPDDRIMILPGIGLAFLIGAWMTRTTVPGSMRLRKMPIAIFIVAQVFIVMVTNQIMRFIEQDRRAFVRSAAEGFDRPLAAGDCAFFLNDVRDWNVLFLQLLLEKTYHQRGILAAFLSDAEHPTVTRVDDNTLRIEAEDEGIFNSFFGAMGTLRGRPKRVGDQLDAGAFTGRITKVSNGLVREVELRFQRPLDSDSYRFYGCDTAGGLKPWKPTLSYPQSNNLDP